MKFFNPLQISYASSAELLSNRERFRSYFRTDPSEENLSPGLAGVVRYYGWRQVAILTQAESLFIDVSWKEGGREYGGKERRGRGISLISSFFVPVFTSLAV